MTQAELARELDISAAMVSKLKARGMPVHALAAAVAWRATNLDPCLLKCLRRPELCRPEPDRAAVVNALGVRAYEALNLGSWGTFCRRVETLRAALRPLTQDEDNRVRLRVEIWDALCGHPGRWSAHTRIERAN